MGKSSNFKSRHKLHPRLRYKPPQKLIEQLDDIQHSEDLEYRWSRWRWDSNYGSWYGTETQTPESEPGELKYKYTNHKLTHEFNRMLQGTHLHSRSRPVVDITSEVFDKVLSTRVQSELVNRNLENEYLQTKVDNLVLNFVFSVLDQQLWQIVHTHSQDHSKCSVNDHEPVYNHKNVVSKMYCTVSQKEYITLDFPSGTVFFESYEQFAQLQPVQNMFHDLVYLLLTMIHQDVYAVVSALANLLTPSNAYKLYNELLELVYKLYSLDDDCFYEYSIFEHKCKPATYGLTVFPDDMLFNFCLCIKNKQTDLKLDVFKKISDTLVDFD